MNIFNPDNKSKEELGQELIKAIKNQNIHECQRLIKIGCDVNITDVDTKTPLHLAVIYDMVTICDLLLSNKAIVNARTKNNETPLHFVYFNKSPQISMLLIRYEADVNIKTKKGSNVLHLAIQEKNDVIIQYLLSVSKIDQKEKDDNGNTALHLAVISKNIISGLYYNQELHKIKNNLGEIPLYLALKNKNFEGAKLIMQCLDYNSINQQDNLGDTILHYISSKKNCDDILEFLISFIPENLKFMNNKQWMKSIDINIRNKYGDTPFHLALGHKNINVLNILFANFSNTIDPNIKNELGSTVLHLASNNQDYETCKTLIQLGSNLNIKNEYNDLPIDYAKEDKIINLFNLYK